MAEIEALDKHACPACGAQATWDPASRKLVCSFCGTESAYAVDRTTGGVEESDLSRALTDTPREEPGWDTARRSVQCQSCKAVMAFAADRVGQNCEFCGSPALVDYKAIQAPIRPWGILPFIVAATKVRDDVRRWLRTRWLAPSSLKRHAFVDRLKSLYIPYWTFDAQVVCPWQAQAGHYYYVNEPVRDAKGRVQMRPVRKVRWTPASGIVEHVFDDELVPGTRGIAPGLLAGVEPFPTKDLVRYDTAFLSGHVVEQYQVVLTEAVKESKDAMTAKLEALCAAQIPGDTHRNLQISPSWSAETFKHVLVPVWLLTYIHRTKPYQVVVNGSTGSIAGRYPKSAWKIFLLVVAAAAIVTTVIVLSQSR